MTPGYAVNSSALFSVATDQAVFSAWYLDGINQIRSVQSWTHTWAESEYGLSMAYKMSLMLGQMAMAA
jgi:hypothetical protein